MSPDAGVTLARSDEGWSPLRWVFLPPLLCSGDQPSLQSLAIQSCRQHEEHETEA